MSAIHYRNNVSPDGIRRYNTRIKALVHSHNYPDGPIDVSDDVVQASLGKNINGAGKANLALTASKSYLNLFYPNDTLNIYFDIGDGSGWTRTFFGYIDRVEEEYSVAPDGSVSTLYHVIATDFQKVFEKTETYFNPYLSGRPDMDGSDFNAANVAGVISLMRGISVHGAPPDMVMNQILLNIGFGGQWVLPDSYRVPSQSRHRELRRQYANNFLIDSLRAQRVPDAQLEQIRASLEREDVPDAGIDPAQLSTQDDVSAALSGALEAQGQDPDVNTAEVDLVMRNAGDRNALSRAVNDVTIRRQILAATDNDARAAGDVANFIALRSTALGNSHTLIDILNIFDFIERLSIDGYAFDIPIWERQGPLISILRSLSNDPVNELIFDLRPVNVIPENTGGTNSVLVAGTAWDTTPDEVFGNEPDDMNQVSGVRYEPSVVMREFPFSTVHKVDASNVEIGLNDAAGNPDVYGVMHFGAIFSNEPNRPGRHLVTVPIQNVSERMAGNSGTTKRHLDVAVVSETEIQSSSFGRSDADHFNLLEMYTESNLGADARYYMAGLLPIITPVHIMRNGLRRRSLPSRFSMFSVTGTLPPLTEAQEEAQEEETTTELSTELIPPVAAHPSLRFANAGQADYGYRPRGVHQNSQINAWVFHNGIDIGGTRDVDIVAIADGNVVCSAPNGAFNYYGNYVVVHHPQFERPDGKQVYSVYAHLTSRNTAVVGNAGEFSSANDCKWTGPNDRSGFQPIPIRKGDVIGKMGMTRGTNGSRGTPVNRDAESAGGVHLHFEIAHRYPTRNDSATRRVPFTELPESGTEAQALTIGSGGRGNPNSMDPVEFFSDNGVDLVAAISALGATNVEHTDDEGDADGGDANDDLNDVPPTRNSEDIPEDEEVAQARTAQRAQISGTVDQADNRTALARWALLQDHWYQHNLEYLSGQIVMRGAPEIRVGYRLDIEERNMSFYVENVQHNWQFPNEMKTTLQVTRGQPNNPYPAYALPPNRGFDTPNSRRNGSRLSQSFIAPDPIAVRRALVFRDASPGNFPLATSGLNGRSENNNGANILDQKDMWEQLRYAEYPKGLLVADTEDLIPDLEYRETPESESPLIEDTPITNELGSPEDTEFPDQVTTPQVV